MKLEVVGHRVLIKPENELEKTESGIVIPEEVKRREHAATQIGTIVDIGPNAWIDFKPGTPWACVGDKVYYARYAGKRIFTGPTNEEEYVIINDEDVQCIIKETDTEVEE